MEDLEKKLAELDPLLTNADGVKSRALDLQSALEALSDVILTDDRIDPISPLLLSFLDFQEQLEDILKKIHTFLLDTAEVTKAPPAVVEEIKADVPEQNFLDDEDEAAFFNGDDEDEDEEEGRTD